MRGRSLSRGASLALLCVAAATSACGPRAALAPRAQVAASIFPLFDVVRRVAGDRVAVALVLPAGHSDHDFDPSPRDLVRLSAVELAFGVGLGLDPWLGRVMGAATDGRARVVELGPELDPRPLRPMEGSLPAGAAVDPHVFLDPLRMAEAARSVARALGGRDPEGAAGYTQRGAQVERDLRALDEELRARAVRWAGRPVVTFHGSFQYFADRYGLEVAAVVAERPGVEPRPRELARVVESIRARRARALFTEPQLDAAAARVVATESGLPLFELDPVGGGPDTPTYEAWLRRNADVLDQALR